MKADSRGRSPCGRRHVTVSRGSAGTPSSVRVNDVKATHSLTDLETDCRSRLRRILRLEEREVVSIVSLIAIVTRRQRFFM